MLFTHGATRMATYESSIVIPVYNRFDLTRTCLRSLAATTSREKVEVIVVDNASTDVTPQACETLGKNLFGEAFTYIRNESNRNFAGASNQGAQCAKGGYLVFLNNDTEALPGWHDPLLADFTEFANIAASGPLLLYPEDKIFGHAIQHLGVLVSPQLRFGHLYAGIPAESPLAKKRRFFQIITAACMAMPRSLFLNAGGFDEAFINGFEDVDLCARLARQGFRMTVNPAARVMHCEGQSEGRGRNDNDNYATAMSKEASLLRADWQRHLENDGLELDVTDDLYLRQALPAQIRARLDPLAEKLDAEGLKKMLVEFPYWQKGMEAFANTFADVESRLKIYERLFNWNKDPEYLIKLFNIALDANKKHEARQACQKLPPFIADYENYRENARFARDKCEEIGLSRLAGKFNEKSAMTEQYAKRHKALRAMLEEMEKRLARHV